MNGPANDARPLARAPSFRSGDADSAKSPIGSSHKRFKSMTRRLGRLLSSISIRSRHDRGGASGQLQASVSVPLDDPVNSKPEMILSNPESASSWAQGGSDGERAPNGDSPTGGRSLFWNSTFLNTLSYGMLVHQQHQQERFTDDTKSGLKRCSASPQKHPTAGFMSDIVESSVPPSPVYGEMAPHPRGPFLFGCFSGECAQQLASNHQCDQQISGFKQRRPPQLQTSPFRTGAMAPSVPLPPLELQMLSPPATPQPSEWMVWGRSNDKPTCSGGFGTRSPLTSAPQPAGRSAPLHRHQGQHQHRHQQHHQQLPLTDDVATTCKVASPGSTPPANSPYNVLGSPLSMRQLKTPQPDHKLSAARQLAYRAPEVAAAARVTTRRHDHVPAALLGGSGNGGGSNGNIRPVPLHRIMSTLEAAHARTKVASDHASSAAAEAAPAAAAADAFAAVTPGDSRRMVPEPLVFIPFFRSNAAGPCPGAPLALPHVAGLSAEPLANANHPSGVPQAVASSANCTPTCAYGDTPISETAPAPSQLLAVSRGLPAAMRRSNWSLDDYTVIKRLYKSASSAVYKAVCTRSGLPVALKVYFLTRVPDNVMHMVRREIEIHSSVVHPNIITLYAAFQTDRHLTLVMEYAARGDLFSIHQAMISRRMDERQVTEMVLGPLLEAITYLHSNGLCHRDIKPENVLFTADWRLKLADFGVSIDLVKERAVTRTGTACYMAPEVARCPLKFRPEDNKNNRDLSYGTACDIYALGVLTYELLVGFTPLSPVMQPENDLVAAETLPTPTPRRALIFPGAASLASREFVSRALSELPQERPSALQMSRHPWITGGDRQLTAGGCAAAAPTTPRVVATDTVGCKH